MSDILEKVKAPAVGLLVVGVLNGAIGLLTLLSGLLRLTGMTGGEKLPIDQAEKAGFVIGTGFGYGVALVSLIAAPVIFFGGLRMLKGKSYGLARTAAVLAIIPLASCCFIVGIPVGIWALMILSQPDVKAFLKGELSYSPNPPNFQ